MGRNKTRRENNGIKQGLVSGKSCYKGGNSRTDRCPCGLETYIPRWSPWAIVLVTMVIRIYHVTRPENSWILHPDEIYQSVEVAFSEVYGYGFRSYEYLPPPGPGNTSMDQQHTRSGMFALRSFMFPMVFSTVLQIAKVFGLDWNPLLICKVFNAIVTSVLPFTCYMFTKKLFSCHMLGVLTCALVASNSLLTIISTHILVNGFISPFLFMGLTFCLPSDEDFTEDKHYINNGYTRIQHGVFSDRNGNVLIKNGCHGPSPSFSTYTNMYCANGTTLSPGSPSDGSQGMNGLTSCNLLKHRNGLRNGVVENHTSTDTTKNTQNRGDNLKHIQHVFAGASLGLVCYIRADTVLFCVVLLMSLNIVRSSNIATRTTRRKLIYVASGTCALVAVCIIDDIVQYGIPYISPIQWFNFNIISGKASKLFGNERLNSYFSIICPDKLCFVLHVCFIINIVIDLSYNNSVIKLRHWNAMAVLISLIIMLFIYSNTGHKEPRFIFNCIVLIAILHSYSIHDILIRLRKWQMSHKTVIIFCAIIVLSYCLNSYHNFPSVKEASRRGMSYDDPEESSHVNSCLDKIGHRNDVTGLFVNASIFNIAGYSVIRQNVPVLIKFHNEYHIYQSEMDNRLGNGTGIKIIGEFSDFIHQSNIYYIYDILTRDSTFNFVVTRSESRAVLRQLGYSHKSGCGKFALFKRERATTHLTRNLIESVTLATAPEPEVLEYEASWLITNGLFSKAIKRINHAFDAGGTRARLYQQLAYSYANIGRTDKVPMVTKQCRKRHGAEECSRTQDKIVLDKEYNRLN